MRVRRSRPSASELLSSRARTPASVPRRCNYERAWKPAAQPKPLRAGGPHKDSPGHRPLSTWVERAGCPRNRERRAFLHPRQDAALEAWAVSHRAVEGVRAAGRSGGSRTTVEREEAEVGRRQSRASSAVQLRRNTAPGATAVSAVHGPKARHRQTPIASPR